MKHLFLLLTIIGCYNCFGNPTAVRVPVVKRILFPASDTSSSLGGTLYLPQGKVSKIVIALNTVAKERLHPDFTSTKDTLLYDRDFISHLTNHRIGVLLIDRHSARSSCQLHVEQSAKTLSSDAEQAYLYLKKDPALKTIPIGVFGSSEAGLAATMLAANNKDISFLILSSTPGASGIELNEYSVFSPVFDNNRFLHITSGLQTMIADSVFIYDSKRYPMTSRSEDIRSFYLCINKTFREIERKVVLQYEDYDTIRVKAGALFRELWQGNRFKTNTQNMFGIEIPAEQYMDTIIKYWYRPSVIEISRWEPQNYFPYIDCPVLMLYGEKDIHINLEASMASVNKIISIYNKSNFVVKKYDNLDHSLLPTMEKTEKKERRKVPEYVFNDIALWMNAQEADADAVCAIERFYNSYTANVASDALPDDSLVKTFLTEGLIEKIHRMANATGADPIIRAQDFREDVIETLKVRRLEGNWYMVSYDWTTANESNRTEIPLRVKKMQKRYLIDYITPEWNGALYGDSLLFDKPVQQHIDASSPMSLLKTFYLAYVTAYCSMPKDLNRQLASLRTAYLTPAALSQFKDAANEYRQDGYDGYDLLIDCFDFDRLWIPSIRFIQLDKDLYQVRYRRENTLYTLVFKIVRENEEYRIDRVSTGATSENRSGSR